MTCRVAHHARRMTESCQTLKLTTIVTMDGLNGATELSGNPSEEVQESHKCIGLQTQGKSQQIMRAIIFFSNTRENCISLY
jgi:hypothetical protein